MRDALHHCGIAFDLDLGSHAPQLLDMHETVFKNRLSDGGSTVRHAVQHHELRLHVGGETRIRRSAHVDRFEFPVHLEVHPIFSRLDLCACIAQLAQQRIENIRPGILEADVPAGGRCRNQKSTGFNAVGHDAITRAVQLAHAFDGNHVAACAANARPHGIEAIRQIHHFRLTRRVFNHCGALRQSRRHHQVLGAGDRYQIHENARALQALRPRMDIAVLDDDFSAHRLQAFDVQIHRPHADRATARETHPRLAGARQHRSQHQDGSAHGFHQLVGCNRIAQTLRSELNLHFLMEQHCDTHLPEQIEHGGNIVQVRHILDFQRLAGKQARAEYRQSGVLGAGNPYLA